MNLKLTGETSHMVARHFYAGSRRFQVPGCPVFYNYWLFIMMADFISFTTTKTED